MLYENRTIIGSCSEIDRFILDLGVNINIENKKIK